MITNESVSWREINIKLVLAAMKIRVRESKVATLLVLCTLPNDDTLHIFFPRIEWYIGCYIHQAMH